MCGRYWLHDNPEEIARRYGINTTYADYCGDDEIYPSFSAPVVLNDGEIVIRLLKWGFPSPAGKGSVINARSETIEARHMFKNLFVRHRCIVPANKFFEWKKEGNRKIKYRLGHPDGSLFSMAGIYGDFKAGGVSFTGFVIITTAPNRTAAKIHDRMPVILPREREDDWLDVGLRDPRELKDMLVPYEGDLSVEKE